MKDKTVIEYNPSEFYSLEKKHKEVKSKISKICNYLILIGLEYINKISGNLENDRLFAIRNSIIFRLHSIEYHFRLLNSINTPNGDRNKIEPQDLMILTSREQKFVFDSIIFNLISTFDYLSCTSIRKYEI